MTEKWRKLLEDSRNNYLSVVQSLSKMQKQIEKIMMGTSENSVSYQTELTTLLTNWVEIGNSVREDLHKIFSENLKTTFDNLSLDLPFKKELDDIYKNIQSSFEKYFSNLKNLDFFKK